MCLSLLPSHEHEQHLLTGLPFPCAAGSILKNQEDTFAAELHRLKQQPVFNLVDFESVVDWIRSTVAEVSMRSQELCWSSPPLPHPGCPSSPACYV